MNLLIDEWIPVRLLEGGTPQQISLRELLCGGKKWELCLPRDDMELAAMQLLICITQALFTPKDAKALLARIVRSVTVEEYEAATAIYADWFCLNHPKQPFMQVRGVKADEATSMDKLLTGLTGATNSCFVNQAGLADGLCNGCAAIALFNQASCAPSFGGGFKASLRGSSPITTLIQGFSEADNSEPAHLRLTIWLNILHEAFLQDDFPWYADTSAQKPAWIEPIKGGETIKAQQIGFIRGLFWQPAHIELLPPVAAKACSCCGRRTDSVYTAFNKAKFNFNIKDTWPHPHSPRIKIIKKAVEEEKFASFTTTAPAWTQLSRFVVQQLIDNNNTEGQQPAAVVRQAQKVLPSQLQKLYLLAGGYRNKQASVLERRHEVFNLNHGWDRHVDVIKDLVRLGLGYRNALVRKALSVFINGIKESKGANKIKGVGAKLHQSVEAQFYRRAEPTIEDTLARIDFNDAAPVLAQMRSSLKAIVVQIFEEATRPYLGDPSLIHTFAVARRTLDKYLNELEPQQNTGGGNGTTKTP